MRDVKIPGVTIPVPDPSVPSGDVVFERFASFVTGNPRVAATVVVVLALAVMWKKPLWRGVLLGVMLFIAISFVVTSN
jgi:hypothetical protein